MTIAVDFDGTIVTHRYPEIGDELPFAIASLIRLQQEGHKLILWTVREGKYLDDAVDFCAKRGLTFYAVNSEYPGSAWSNKEVRKISADLYIDDCNFGGIPDWPTIYATISGRHQHKKKGFFGRLRDRCRRARDKYNR